MNEPYLPELSPSNEFSTNVRLNYLNELEIRIDDNERRNQFKFDDFNDIDMIYYYVYQNKNLLYGDSSMSEHTKKSYVYTLKKFLQLSEKVLLDEKEYITEGTSRFKKLEPYHIKKIVNALNTQPFVKRKNPDNPNEYHYVSYSKGTVSTYVTIIKQFLRWLYKTGKYTDKDLSEDIPSVSLRMEDRPNRDVSQEQAKFILDGLKPKKVQYSIILALATTGLRIAALTNIKMSDISKDTIEGQEYYVIEVMEKGRKLRRLVIKPELFEIFLYSRKLHGLDLSIGTKAESDQYLFVSAKRTGYSEKSLSGKIGNWISAVYNAHSVPQEKRITAHHLRHFFASQTLIKARETGVDVDVQQISNALGHASLNTTMIYLEREESVQNSVTRKIDLSEDLLE